MAVPGGTKTPLADPPRIRVLQIQRATTLDWLPIMGRFKNPFSSSSITFKTQPLYTLQATSVTFRKSPAWKSLQPEKVYISPIWFCTYSLVWDGWKAWQMSCRLIGYANITKTIYRCLKPIYSFFLEWYLLLELSLFHQINRMTWDSHRYLRLPSMRDKYGPEAWK